MLSPANTKATIKRRLLQMHPATQWAILITAASIKVWASNRRKQEDAQRLAAAIWDELDRRDAEATEDLATFCQDNGYTIPSNTEDLNKSKKAQEWRREARKNAGDAR